jgi:two-component system OmpR family sensor kinase
VSPVLGESLRARFGVRAFLVSLVVLGAAVVGTGLFWRATLMDDITDTLADHITSVDSELEILAQDNRFPPTGTDPEILTQPEHGAQVLSSEGTLVAASRELVGLPAAIPASTVVSAPSTTVTTVVQNPVYGHALAVGESFTLDGNRYAVEAITALTDVDEAAQLTFIWGPVVALVVSLGLGLGVTLSVDRALRPVRQLTRRAADLAAGRRHLRLDVSAETTELQELTSQLDELLDAIRAAFEREQAFLDDASHELRTPIAIARVELELAQRGAPENEGVRAALDSAIEELDRVESTASALLVLARARAASDHGFGPVEMGDLGNRAAERVRRDPRHRSSEITVTGQASVLGDEDALERALVNLIANAADHCRSSVTVTIGCPDDVTVEIADDGPGIPDHLLDHLFDRFSRGASEESGSVGLGTAITAEILAAHEGSIVAANRATGGAVVTMHIPKASDPANLRGDDE